MTGTLERWKHWGAQSPSRRIFSAALTVFSVTSLVKVAGAAKVILLARYYGTGDALDAFLIAFLVPSFLADVVAGAISSALVPSLVRVRERNDTGQGLVSNITLYCAMVCLVLTGVMLTAARPLLRLVASGFSPEKLTLTRELLFVLAPILLMGGVGAVWRAALNALGNFALPAAAPAITPLVTVAAVVGMAAAGVHPDALALAWGTTLGSILETALMAWKLRQRGLLPLPRWEPHGTATRTVVQQYWPIMASSLVFGASAYVNQSMAAMLGPGSVSALNYGTRLLSVALAMCAGALGTAVLPHFSTMVVRDEWNELRKTLAEYRRTVLLVGVPLTLVLVWISPVLVRIAFERGAFTPEDTRTVVLVQRFALLQLPAAILTAMLARLISSLHANRLLLAGAGISLAANIVLNYVLMQRFGAAGITLSTSVSSYIYYCYLARVLFRMKGGHHD